VYTKKSIHNYFIGRFYFFAGFFLLAFFFAAITFSEELCYLTIAKAKDYDKLLFLNQHTKILVHISFILI